MTTITNTFRLHVDPSLYGFKFEGPEYVDISYLAWRNGTEIEVVPNINAPMYLLGMIVIAGKWFEFNNDVKNAAISNATGEFDKQNIHPTIMRALAPHLNSSAACRFFGHGS